MKTYKLNNVEVSEDQVRELIKSNPELLEKKEVKGRYYFPKLGELCYEWYADGDITQDLFSNRYPNTGVFQTHEEAQLAYDKQCAIVRCWKWAQENAPFEPDWEDIDQYKHDVVYYHQKEKFEIIYSIESQSQFTLPYFKSKEDCERFIEANKADLELLFLK